MKLSKLIGLGLLTIFFLGMLYITVILADYYLLGNNFSSVDYIAPFLLQFCGIPSVLFGLIGLFLVWRNNKSN